MKKVLMSLFTIAIVGTLITGGAIAYFSDTETSLTNTYSSGTIDFEMADGTGDNDVQIIFEDMKPCDVRFYTIKLHNLGTNDGPLYLHFDVEPGYNLDNRSEPELEAEQGTPKDDIENHIEIDLALVNAAGEVEYFIIAPRTGVTLGDLNCKWIPLGWFGGGFSHVKYLRLSFHLLADTGNEYQGDGVQFTIDAHMTDHNSPGGPNPIILFLENKENTTWDVIPDGTFGYVVFNPQGSTFNYTLNAFGLAPDTEYALIYYADPWPGNHPGALIGKYTTDGSGNIIGAAGNPDLGMDMPRPPDANFVATPSGAKIWLIPSSYYNEATNSVTGWPAPSGSEPCPGWLYETNLIKYDDTDA